MNINRLNNKRKIIKLFITTMVSKKQKPACIAGSCKFAFHKIILYTIVNA